jgi:two-component system, NtrC family, response regulator HydG
MPTPPRILIVDDEAGMRRSLSIMLRRQGWSVVEAAGGEEAVELMGGDVFGLMIADLRMGTLSGLDLLRTVKQTNPSIEVILMTAFGTIEAAVEAMKLGAFDFVAKPFQPEEILLRVRNALDKRRLTEEIDLLRAEVSHAFGVTGIVGASEAIRQVLKILPRAAQTDSTVLITGESGTGKELVARALHATSRRAKSPFVSVSCAALPEQLLESELFGHVKGAFTGAQLARKGLLEEAHQGTFFLDEIGEAPLAIQAKLLRVIEDRTLRRLGDNRTIPIEIRIVAATNRDLDAAVRDRQFREDLLYRLNVIRIHMPTLRERMEDVPLLARHFLAQHCQRLGRHLEGISAGAMEALSGYSFPGNVRELVNVIEQAVALANGPMIERSDLPPKLRERRSGNSQPPPASAGLAPLREVVGVAEQEQILHALGQADWNVSRAAAILGVSRNTLRYRIEKYDLRPPTS